MALRLLCVSEGRPPGGPLGHLRIEAALRAGLEGRDDVEGRFADLGEAGPVAAALTRGVPVLRRWDLDLQVARWHAVHGARARRLVARAVREQRPDAMTVASHAIALGLGREMRRTPTLLSVDATVWQVREMALWRPLHRVSRSQLWASLWLERRALSRAAVVLAWSKWAQRGVRETCPEANVAVHHPGIDTETFRPGNSRPDGAGGPVRVLFVGGRFRAKGGEDLLAAAQPLLGDALELDLVTPEPVPEARGVRTHRLPAGDRRVVELYQRADLVCLPSHGDAFPWVVLEALACGTPVLATSTGGISDIVREGETGMLVPMHDRRALRIALEAACRDPERLAEMGARGRALVEAEYDARRQTGRLLKLARAARR